MKNNLTLFQQYMTDMGAEREDNPQLFRRRRKNQHLTPFRVLYQEQEYWVWLHGKYLHIAQNLFLKTVSSSSALQMQDLPTFVLRRRTALDSIGLKLYLNRDIHVEEPSFRRQFYLECSHKDIKDAETMLKASAFRQAVQRVFHSGGKRVYSASGHLVARYDWGQVDDFSSAWLLTRFDDMQALVTGLPAIECVSGKSAYKGWQMVLGGGLGLFFACLFFHSIADSNWWVIDTSPLKEFSRPLSRGGVLGVLVLSYFFSYNKTYGLRQFLLSFAFGTLSVGFVVRGVAVTYNGWGDNSREKITLHAFNKKKQSQDSSTRYTIYFKGKEPFPKHFRLHVSKAEYDATKTTGDPYEITYGKGNLGAPWLHSYRRVEP